MLRQLLAATAIVTIATAAQAANAVNTDTTATTPPVTSTPAAGDMFLPAATSGDHLASKLIGLAVYDGTSDSANKIGTVNDLVVANDGSVQAVVVGVGGFLGIGQKNVALDFPNLQWATVNGGPVLVAIITKDQLTNAPTFDTAAIDNAQAPATGTPAAADQSQMAASSNPGTSAPAATDTTGAGTTDQQLAQQNNAGASTSTAPATGTMGLNGTSSSDLAQQTMPPAGAMSNQSQMAAQSSGSATAVAPNPSTMSTVDVASVSAKDLMNATVYSQNNENVGNVGDVVLSQDGKIDALVLDVGGFLGLGTKPVAIGFDSLDIRKDANGNLFVFTHFTKDELESAPTYDKDQYAAQRGTMRLSNP
ncbi:MAG TPA: PRC-barrel domain-containing protein [Bauldia sp.]|nr:PRC-barrel domain-containing protein [Bauldia sp.]